MHSEISPVLAWAILRLTYGWIFLAPLKGLLKNWKGSVALVKILTPWPWAKNLAALGAGLMILVMIFGSLGIILGIEGRLAGFLLMIYSLFGIRVHFQLAKQAMKQEGSDSLGVVGNITSGQKNVVLAGVGAFFMLMGTGPLSFIY